ncbi:Lactose operon transcription activator [Paenibacillus nuruki]|uniref:Lactose operon transcription activator n=1 Tax=Paenibacillus nuruki TaxID=1886670 RepID=A0A1E3L2G1_9BACL|nr:AraC family transcriptional regulator [Paenibacillus nuruki]ODP27801.1 Lactose operon transcription activator [Paenibacillus nuruki]
MLRSIETNREVVERFLISPSLFSQSGGLRIAQAGRYFLKAQSRRLFTGIDNCFWIANRHGGVIIHKGQSYILGSYNVWCISPNEPFEYINNMDEDLETYYICFTGPQARLLIEQSGMHQGYSEVSAELFDQLEEKFERILSTNEDSNQFSSELRRLELLYSIFAELSSDHPSHINHYVADTLSSTTLWMEEAIAYIHSHYDRGITVADVASHVGVHRTHFSKQFHLVHQTPPAEYIRSLKMSKARQLLTETNYSLAEIAYSVGYPDLFSFSKAFKKHAGITPKKYRTDRF